MGLEAGRIYEPHDTLSIKGERYTVVRYSPSLLHHVARRGAQIINPKDAAYMISRSGISQGAKVLESGIGSGILTAHILWAIGRGGILHSVDRDRSAVETATRNLERFVDLSNWTASVGDIAEYRPHFSFDAAFLDLPEPWKASDTISGCVRNGGVLVTYLPTFDQVEKTMLEYTSSGFDHEESCEITLRTLIVRKNATRPDNAAIGHTAFISFYRR